MGEWLVVRLGTEVQYISLAQVIDITFKMSSASGEGAAEVMSATVRLTGPGDDSETTYGGQGAKEIFEQVTQPASADEPSRKLRYAGHRQTPKGGY